MSQIEKADNRQLRVSPENLDAIFKTPMLAVPMPLRPVVAQLWMMNRHLQGMESPLSITVTLSVWIERWGLDIKDAEEILSDMTKPSNMAEIRYCSDLTSRLAQLCAARIERRTAAQMDIKRFL